jgi:hypothetical protein
VDQNAQSQSIEELLETSSIGALIRMTLATIDEDDEGLLAVNENDGGSTP